MASAAISSMVDRVVSSWGVAQVAHAARVAAGVQPTQPFATLAEIAAGNGAYVLITIALYAAMARREAPFEVRKIMAVYNLICVGLAGAVVYGIVTHKMRDPGTFACNAGDGTAETDVRLSWYFWLFYIQKYWEFCDTWFFLLRRSFRQVSFLHVYHHASIAVVVGTILPYNFSGDMYLPIVLNAFVHVLMYSHYFVTSLGYKGTWWAPYLTGLQLIQFLLIASQNWIAYQAGPSCGAPDFAKVLLFFYMGTMLMLFGKFFASKYLGPKERSADKAKDGKKPKAA